MPYSVDEAVHALHRAGLRTQLFRRDPSFRVVNGITVGPKSHGASDAAAQSILASFGPSVEAIVVRPGALAKDAGGVDASAYLTVVFKRSAAAVSLIPGKAGDALVIHRSRLGTALDRRGNVVILALPNFAQRARHALSDLP